MNPDLRAPAGQFQLPADPLTPPSYLRLIEAVNAPKPGRPGLLHDGFLSAAAGSADRLALVCGELRFNFAELHAIASAIARDLVAAGIGSGQLVPVIADRGWQQVTAALGVLLTGAAYVPLDPSWPRPRLQSILEEITPQAMLVGSGIRDQCRLSARSNALAVDQYRETAQAATPQVLLPTVSNRDLAYVTYISGFSGKPLGVAVSHAAALDALAAISEEYAVGREDRAFGLSDLSCDRSVFDIFGVLGSGGCLVLPSHEEDDPNAWLELIARETVTIWNSAPEHAEQLVDADRAGAAPGDCTGLRLFLLSGGQVPLTLPGRLKSLAPTARVVVLDGTTEAAISALHQEIGEVPVDWTAIPYGKPLGNRRAYVLNDGLNLCPAWVEGSIYLGGKTLSDGYWGDEAATSKRFIEHPRTGERLCHTGERGRYRSDGAIEPTGREDLLIWRRGHRIEPAEIERVLLAHDSIVDAAAILMPLATDASQIVAFIVQRNAPDDGAVWKHLQENLPTFLIPDQIAIVSHLPRGLEGELLRENLPRLRDGLEVGPTGALESGSAAALEDVILTVSSVLGVEGLCGDEELLSLGADSVIIIRLANRMEIDFGVRLDVGFLFNNPTIKEIADLCQEVQ